MIINQWYTSHIDKVNGTITIEQHDQEYNIIINNNIMATVQDKGIADILVKKIIQFNERYRRTTDTFDMYKELEIINKNKNATQLGCYFS